MSDGRGEVVHLLLRFSDELYRTGGVIDKHRAVIETEGAVWWGKLGRAVSRQRLENLEAQLERGVPTFVYLVQGKRTRLGTQYVACRGDAIAFSSALPPGEESLVPPYYDELELKRYIGTWIKLTDIADCPADVLQSYVISSSRAPASESIRTSMAAMFLIEPKPTRRRQSTSHA